MPTELELEQQPAIRFPTEDDPNLYPLLGADGTPLFYCQCCYKAHYGTTIHIEYHAQPLSLYWWLSTVLPIEDENVEGGYRYIALWWRKTGTWAEYRSVSQWSLFLDYGAVGGVDIPTASQVDNQQPEYLIDTSSIQGGGWVGPWLRYPYETAGPSDTITASDEAKLRESFAVDSISPIVSYGNTFNFFKDAQFPPKHSDKQAPKLYGRYNGVKVHQLSFPIGGASVTWGYETYLGPGDTRFAPTTPPTDNWDENFQHNLDRVVRNEGCSILGCDTAGGKETYAVGAFYVAYTDVLGDAVCWRRLSVGGRTPTIETARWWTSAASGFEGQASQSVSRKQPGGLVDPIPILLSGMESDGSVQTLLDLAGWGTLNADGLGTILLNESYDTAPYNGITGNGNATCVSVDYSLVGIPSVATWWGLAQQDTAVSLTFSANIGRSGGVPLTDKSTVADWMTGVYVNNLGVTVCWHGWGKNPLAYKSFVSTNVAITAIGYWKDRFPFTELIYVPKEKRCVATSNNWVFDLFQTLKAYINEVVDSPFATNGWVDWSGVGIARAAQDGAITQITRTGDFYGTCHLKQNIRVAPPVYLDFSNFNVSF